jgi:tetratricopeptide (TPR) repeat protein
VTDDIDFQDAEMVLYNARKILDFCELATAAAQIVRARELLLGGYRGEEEAIQTTLPPEDEVVMSFVGRNRELIRLNDWMLNSSSKRWALSGDGGKGKSAIAYAFARMVSRRKDHHFQGVLWISAKQRRFVEGTTLIVDRPDFHDKASAQSAILDFFGVPETDGSRKEDVVLELLEWAPILLIVDDLDTVEDAGEDAIQFLLMDIPAKTKSRVLVTSRRVLFGMSNLTTQIEGLTDVDCEEYLRTRCDLMGVAAESVLRLKEQIRQVTDGSPLFIEDLLRLHQTGLSVENAIGLWAEHRGLDARRYAMQREYDQLDEDAQQVLLALSIQGSCEFSDLEKGLNWSGDRLINAMRQLQKMFLMPSKISSGSRQFLSLNRNVQSLVLEEFRNTEQFRRTDRLMKAATGELRPKRREEAEVRGIIRNAGFLVQEGDFDQAKSRLEDAIDKYPARGDLHASLAWVEKKREDFAAARLHFRRAHDLACDRKDAYWHWSDLESSTNEWKASADVARLALTKFGEDQGFLFRLGYAEHRQGRELINDGEETLGTKLCLAARENLEKARQRSDSEDRNHSLKHQIYRAIALNLEALGEGAALARHFAIWQNECPYASDIESEYSRLRQKFPQFLRAH